MASDMLKNIPEVIDVEDPEPRATNQPRPTLSDIVKIGTGMDLHTFKRKPPGGKVDKNKLGMYTC